MRDNATSESEVLGLEVFVNSRLGGIRDARFGSIGRIAAGVCDDWQPPIMISSDSMRDDRAWNPLHRYDHDAVCFIADVPAVAECVCIRISTALSHSRPIRAEIDCQTANRGIHWGTGG
jgi:hypothetical protein